MIQFSSPFLLLGGFGCCGCWLWQWGFGSGDVRVANGFTAGNAIGLGGQGRTVTELVSCFSLPFGPGWLCSAVSRRNLSTFSHVSLSSWQMPGLLPGESPQAVLLQQSLSTPHVLSLAGPDAQMLARIPCTDGSTEIYLWCVVPRAALLFASPAFNLFSSSFPTE